MTTLRVHELAAQHDVRSTKVLSALARMGEAARTPSSAVPPQLVARLRQTLTADGHPRRVLEPDGQPLPPTTSGRVRQDVAKAGARRLGRTSRRGLSRRDAQHWAEQLFEPADARTWISRGVPADQPWVAAAAASVGLVPDDMAAVLDDCTVSQHLSRHEDPADVKRRLNEARRV